MRHREWSTFDGVTPTVCSIGHDLCFRSASVIPSVGGGFPHYEMIGQPNAGFDPVFGAAQWAQLVEDSGMGADLSPPDLHGWLLSLPIPDWSAPSQR